MGGALLSLSSPRHRKPNPYQDSGVTKNKLWVKFITDVVNGSAMTDSEMATISQIKTEAGDPLRTDDELSKAKMDVLVTASPADIRAKCMKELSVAWHLIDVMSKPPTTGDNDTDGAPDAWKQLSRMYPTGTSRAACFAFYASDKGRCTNMQGISPFINGNAKAAEEKKKKRQGYRERDHAKKDTALTLTLTLTLILTLTLTRSTAWPCATASPPGGRPPLRSPPHATCGCRASSRCQDRPPPVTRPPPAAL